MSNDLTRAIPMINKDLLGGVDKVYLFSFVKYSRSQIVISGQELVTFPATTIYKTHSVATNYSETTSVEGGAIAFGQSFSVEFPKTSVESELYKMVRGDWRAIYIDRIGNIRILGLYNGLDAQISNETGADKSGFNGYKVTFTGKEDNQAYFIDDLAAVGFVVWVDPDQNYVFEDGCDYIFEDGNNFIFE